MYYGACLRARIPCYIYVLQVLSVFLQHSSTLYIVRVSRYGFCAREGHYWCTYMYVGGADTVGSVACVCVDTFFDCHRLLSVVLEFLTVAVGIDLGLFGDRGQPELYMATLC